MEKCSYVASLILCGSAEPLKKLAEYSDLAESHFGRFGKGSVSADSYFDRFGKDSVRPNLIFGRFGAPLGKLFTIFI